MATDTQRKFIIIRPGETRALPKGAKIVSAVNYGNVTVISECGDLPIEDAQCYLMRWGVSKNDYNNLDKDSTINYIKILGVQYNINRNIDDEYQFPTGDTNDLEDALKSVIPVGLMKIESITYTNNSSGRREFTLRFSSIPSISDTIEMKITGRGFSYGAYVKPVKIECGAEAPTIAD